MTTKDVMAALERITESMDLMWDHLSTVAPSSSVTEDIGQHLEEHQIADLATLRAFVTETGPVREVLELDCDILHLRHPGEWCAVNEKMRGTGPTYAAACTAALEAVDGADR